MLPFTSLLLQKSNKKRAPKTITPRFREGALIKFLYYCTLKFSSLIFNTSNDKDSFPNTASCFYYSGS